MTRMLIVAGMLLATGCGILPGNPDVEDTYKIVYSDFLADAAHYNRELDLGDLEIHSGQFQDPAIKGECSTGEHRKEVTIDKTYWNNVDLSGKQMLLYHELGHCVLGQDHRPNSIMNATLLMSWVLLRPDLREYYLSELFLHQGV